MYIGLANIFIKRNFPYDKWVFRFSKCFLSKNFVIVGFCTYILYIISLVCRLAVHIQGVIPSNIFS